MTLLTQADASLSTNKAEVHLRALLQNVAFSPIDDIGWIRVTGEDRVRWLNGMVTNSILALHSDLTLSDGCYNFILSAQGRIQGTATVFAQQNSILLETDRTQIIPLMTTLDRFIIMDDVELADVTDLWAGVSAIGPQAASLLQQIGLPPTGTETPSMQTIAWQGAEVAVIHAHSPLTTRFELWTDPATAKALTEALSNAGTQISGPQAIEWLRILEGTPRYGVDIRDKELPQETGQIRALHFSKGCYLGQEIVERIHSRGNVRRTFSGFRLQDASSGPLPAAGTPIEAEGKQVGELTSVATVPLPTGTVSIGIGYIRRDALDRALPLSYRCGAQSGTVLPVSTPFKDL